jgi:hypothetical protein
MFVSAAVRDSKLNARKLARQLDAWRRGEGRWYDGTVGSIDKRIAHTDHLLTFARGVLARLASTQAGYLSHNALPALEQSRRELAALRDDLLSGSPARHAAYPGRAGRGTSIVISAHRDFPDSLIF